MTAHSYRVQVRIGGEPWRMTIGGLWVGALAMKAAEKEASRHVNLALGPVPVNGYVRVMLGETVVASWTNGTRDLRGSAA